MAPKERLESKHVRLAVSVRQSHTHCTSVCGQHAKHTVSALKLSSNCYIKCLYRYFTTNTVKFRYFGMILRKCWLPHNNNLVAEKVIFICILDQISWILIYKSDTSWSNWFNISFSWWWSWIKCKIWIFPCICKGNFIYIIQIWFLQFPISHWQPYTHSLNNFLHLFEFDSLTLKGRDIGSKVWQQANVQVGMPHGNGSMCEIGQVICYTQWHAHSHHAFITTQSTLTQQWHTIKSSNQQIIGSMGA